ncbi:hypothetical protein MHYP_G00296540 [Metynnis hypsauchen]
MVTTSARGYFRIVLLHSNHVLDSGPVHYELETGEVRCERAAMIAVPARFVCFCRRRREARPKVAQEKIFMVMVNGSVRYSLRHISGDFRRADTRAPRHPRPK